MSAERPEPKFKPGDMVRVGQVPTTFVIHTRYWSEGTASVFAPKNVWRYTFVDHDPVFAPTEDQLTLWVPDGSS